VLEKDLFQVGAFINHAVDVQLMEGLGGELATRCQRFGATVVLTAETSGLLPAFCVARELHIGLIYARKVVPKTWTGAVQTVAVWSHTHAAEEHLHMSLATLAPSDRVLVIDDFLSDGHTALALTRLVRSAGATVAGVGVLICKRYRDGVATFEGLGIGVEALVYVADVDQGRVMLEGSSGWN
jgi:xanthine phosphoribosyltransferase